MKKCDFERIYINILEPKTNELKLYDPIGIGELCRIPGAKGCYCPNNDGWWEVYTIDDWQNVSCRAITDEDAGFDMLYEMIIGDINSYYKHKMKKE